MSHTTTLFRSSNLVVTATSLVMCAGVGAVEIPSVVHMLAWVPDVHMHLLCMRNEPSKRCVAAALHALQRLNEARDAPQASIGGKRRKKRFLALTLAPWGSEPPVRAATITEPSWPVLHTVRPCVKVSVSLLEQNRHCIWPGSAL